MDIHIDTTLVTKTVATIHEQASLLKDDASSTIKNDARLRLIDAARSLITQLETPTEFSWRSFVAEPAKNSAIKIALDTGVLDMLRKEGQPQTLQQLASTCGADLVLLGRVMRHLAAMKFVEQTSLDSFRNTPTASAMSEDEHRGGIMMNCSHRTWLDMPEFLRSIKYENPIGMPLGPFQYTKRTHRKLFDWMYHERPEIGQAFGSYMTGLRKYDKLWVESGMYPWQERLGEKAEAGDDKVLLVDVGGGVGHDIIRFAKAMSAIPGRFILQDLPSVTSNAISLPDRVSVVAHDFFEPQPDSSRNARVYHTHFVCHSWPDDVAVKILINLREAMRSNYSKLLLYEYVIKEMGAGWQDTAVDWTSLANPGSMERTEGMWKDLLRRAGLKVIEIFEGRSGSESLIEAVRDDDSD